MKKLVFLFTLLLFAAQCFGQFVITPLPGSGVASAPVDANGWQNFKLTLTQNVTFSFVMTPPLPAPAQVVSRVVFTQDATGGRTVAFASNISNGCAVNGAANATTVCQFLFDSVANVWQGLSGASAGGSINGIGLQMFNTTTTCTTAATINTPCTTAAITLPVAYADTNYRIVCNGLPSVTAFPQIQTITKSNTTFTITVNNLTAAAASYASFDCVVGHN